MKKTVLITGASSGIGKATAFYFHKKGWNVAATMRRPDAERDLTTLANLACLRLDVTQIHTIQNAIKETQELFGAIDVLVNNAAYSLTGPFEAATSDQIQAFYDVVVFGVMNVTREILPHFRERHAGTIVNVTSLGGLIGMPLSSFYASAKWAVEGFSESLRFELQKLGIHMKLVEPGGVKTQFASNAIIVRKKDVPSYEKTLEKRLAAYERRRGQLNDPKIIAKVIFQAAKGKNGRLRHLAGNDAKIFWFLWKILPFSIFTSLLRKLAG
ncbi:MAG: SDR family oxidoreductase [Desulfobacteraceae bacterium]|jgi:NAD(P)-dependent dehydrogenase (short-subunit alcohol dehydrogenase family)